VEPARFIAPLPETFSVLAYMPGKEKARLYGWDQIVEVAQALRSIEFNVVGLRHGESLEAPPNVRLHGWANDLKPYLQDATVLWRPVQHDGLSFMVLEALAEGRHVLYSYPFAGCIEATTAATAQRELQRLVALHDAKTLKLNEAGMLSVANHFSPQKVRADLLRRWEEIILQSSDVSSGRLVERRASDASRQLTL
jgi:hypothetical protein